MTLLEFIYEYMTRSPETEPYDIVDGAPLYALQASRQLISHMYRDDPALREDARFSSAADGLLSKYNFQSTIRGMFIPAPIQYPRRFNLIAGGVPVEVLPTVNGVPAEMGSFTGINPAYMLATHEEVLIHGRNPFTLGWRPTVESLGDNTSFGPEPGYLDYWQWINPLTNQDPFRRVGFFASSASLAVLPQYSEGLYGVLLARPSVGLTAQYNPVASCPPNEPSCNNNVPAVGCPCPLILGVAPNPITSGQYFFTLARPLDAGVEPTDVVQVGVSTGGYVNATVVDIATGRYTFSATLPAGTPTDNCTFTALYCDDTLGCYADVEEYSIDCTDATRLDLILEYPIKADTASDIVTLFLGDGTTVSATVVSLNMATNTWKVDVGSTAFCDQQGGVIGICVPPGTDASCPACGFGPTITQCTEE
jgi:hypothetical protein